MLYMYIILKYVGYIFEKIAYTLSKKFVKLNFLQKYIGGETIYLIIKNCTYFSMVVVYTIYSDKDGLMKVIAAAMGVLFLIDTFFDKEKAIQNKIGTS